MSFLKLFACFLAFIIKSLVVAQNIPATFTHYGIPDSPNCATTPNACGPVTDHGFTAAISQKQFGAGPGQGAGPGCNQCWTITIETNENHQNVAKKTIEVTVNNLCPIQGNQEWCNVPNRHGGQVHFDLCSDSGAAAAFFTSSGSGIGYAVNTCGGGNSSSTTSNPGGSGTIPVVQQNNTGSGSGTTNNHNTGSGSGTTNNHNTGSGAGTNAVHNGGSGAGTNAVHNGGSGAGTNAVHNGGSGVTSVHQPITKPGTSETNPLTTFNIPEHCTITIPSDINLPSWLTDDLENLWSRKPKGRYGRRATPRFHRVRLDRRTSFGADGCPIFDLDGDDITGFS